MQNIKLLIILMCWIPAALTPVSAQKVKDKQSKSNTTSSSSASLSGQQKAMAEFYFVEGMKFMSLSNVRSAQAYFEKAYTINPSSDGLNYMLAKTNFFGGNYSKALAHIQKALKADPKNREYYLVQAKIYEAQKNFPEAIKTYKKLVSEVRGGERFYFDLAQVQMDSKDYMGAISTFNKIEEVYGKSLELTRQKQQIWQLMGKTDEAIKEGNALIKAYPNNLEYQVAQAELLYISDKKPEAFAILESVLKKDPDNVNAHVTRYNFYNYQNDKVNANKELDWILNSSADPEIKQEAMKNVLVNAKTDDDKAQALKLAETFYSNNPTDGTAILIYGDALFINAKKEAAWKQYIQATNYFPENFNIWIQVMSLDYEFQKYDSLSKHGDAAVDIFPNQASIWYFRGVGYYFQKNYTKAVESLKETKNLAGSNVDVKINALLLMGDAYNELKQYPNSDAAFEEVLKMDRYNVQALNNYSYYLSLRKEKLDVAKEMANRVVSRHPGELTYIDTYAWVLYQMKDYKGAKAQLEKFMATADNGTILEHYGDIIYQLGDKDGALEYWKRAQKAGDASEFIEKKIADKKLYE